MNTRVRHARAIRAAIITISVSAMLLTLSIGGALGWSQPTLSALCAPNANSYSWKIVLPQEADYNIEFSWSADFSSAWTEDFGSAGTHTFDTARGGSTLHARWASDKRVKTQATANEELCVQPTPTPTPTPTPAITPTPKPSKTPDTDDASLKIRKISTLRTDTGRVIRLEGAVFTVEGQPGTFTTDVNGEFCITGLPEDVVLRVTEITPPAGYELAEPAWQDVEVDDDGQCNSAEAVFENAPEAIATPTPTPEGSEAGSTGTPAPSASATPTPAGSVAASTSTPRPLPNTAADRGSVNVTLAAVCFAAVLFASIGTLAVANVAASRRRGH
jgi:hypothetical protein